MPFWPSQGPPPDQIIITDTDVWNTMTLEQRKQHINRIKQARLDCRAYGSLSLAGNATFIVGAAVGSVLSMLAPSHWTLSRRAAPFILLGLAGIWADNSSVKRQCELTYPEPAASLKAANDAAGSIDSPLSASPSLSMSPSSVDFSMTPQQTSTELSASALTSRGTVRSPNLHSVEISRS